MSLALKRFHLQSTEHRNTKRTWHCELCDKDMSLQGKPSHTNSIAHSKNAKKTGASFMAKLSHILLNGPLQILENNTIMLN